MTSAMLSVDKEKGIKEGEKEGVGKGEVEVRGFDSLPVCAVPTSV